MFELIRISGSRESGIELQTRLRTPISNAQSPEPDFNSGRIFALLLKTHPNWKQRKSTCGYYNCAGHVWASRRTAVYEGKWWNKILDEDGYRKLLAKETPCEGDLALYSDKKTGNFLHVGVIYHIHYLVEVTGVPVGSGTPWILSKWNDSSGEVLHSYNDVPWNFQFEVNFWTDRP